MLDTKAPSLLGGIGRDRRRTQRVQIAMPVRVSSVNSTLPFQEETHTIAVNAHGCMVLLAAPVTAAQQISILNLKTEEELPCRVAFIGQKDSGKMQVAVEFNQASPRFWHMSFPPDDWDRSAERKRPAAVQPSA